MAARRTSQALVGSAHPPAVAPAVVASNALALTQSLADALPLGIAVFRPGPAGEPVCVLANDQFCQWLGYGRHEAVGLLLSQLRDIGSDKRLREALGRACADHAAPSNEFELKLGDGRRPRPVSVRLTSMRGAADGGSVVMSLRDCTLEQQAERNLRQSMLHDALTGLGNRVLFLETLETALEQRSDQAVSVLMLNIDRFKVVNESLGHTAGDELLIALARRLLTCVGERCALARLSGDEFALLVRGPTSAIDIAETVHEALRQPFTLSGRQIHITASIGIASTLPGSTETFGEDLIRDADFAMHRAKSKGRMRTECYQRGAHTQARYRFQLETDLRRAIEREELHLRYQPLFDLESDRIAGFEALARWTHPRLGAVPPSEFIPLAEETGLIVPLGRWALREACQQMKLWCCKIDSRSDLAMAVNLSSLQFAQDDVVAAVGEALRTSGLPPHCLKVELTESSIVEDPIRAKLVLDQIKGLGVSVLMDDFGTGYSSLAYLQRLPIDILKIDRSFVNEMLTCADSAKIVQVIISLAASLGMKTVAEGIEQREQAEVLHQLGCTLGQGFFFARPMLPEDVERTLLAPVGALS